MVKGKNRYFLMEIHCENSLKNLTQQSMRKDILNSIEENFGIFGYACVITSLNVKYLNAHTNTAIIRVNHKYFQMLQQALTLLRTMDGKVCMLRTLHIAGTIKSCQKKLMEYDKKYLLFTYERLPNDYEKKKLVKKFIEQYKLKEKRM
ncbi:hypothetical protein LOD99_4441 [Oopsacas minuta]|uniref:Ribonuclease P/MRP protein subunit POP5 n=1 Tax=Oopsacas minuta TaxID=111878 RepID=A0AAV7JV20_9METZ|nr:hypothetical protein LOD99_4441 [Oopsacas minuta]